MLARMEEATGGRVPIIGADVRAEHEKERGAEQWDGMCVFVGKSLSVFLKLMI